MSVLSRGRFSSKQRRYRWYPWALLAASLSLTAYSGWLAYRQALLQANQKFAETAGEIQARIEDRIQAYQQVLRGGLGLFAASDQVTRDEWRRYVKGLELDRGFSGIQGVGFSVYLKPSDLAAHERQVRSEGFPQYAVWPTGERDEYSAIVFLEPFAGRNLRAFGYDMLSEPIRREAMHRARASGRIAASGKVVLVQETDTDVQPGFLIYLPLYRPGLPAETAEQRLAALVGWVYAPFRMRDLMAGILGQLQEGVHVDLYDGVETDRDHLLYDNRRPDEARGDESLIVSRHIDVGSHLWTLEMRAVPGALGVVRGETLLIAGGGGVISFLLFAVARSLVSTNIRAREIAQRLTESLRRSRELHHRIVTLAHDGIFAIDTAARLTYVNPRMAEILECGADAMLGQPLVKFVDPGHHDRIRAKLANRRQGVSETYELDFLRADGERVSTLVSGAPLVDERSVFLGSFAVVSDITARKRAEEALQESESRFRSLADSANDAIVSIDRSGRVVFWSRSATRIFGYSEAEMLGNPVITIMPEDVRAKHAQSFERYLRTGESKLIGESVEMRGRRRAGEAFPLELSLSTWSFRGQRYFTAIMRDISERKRVEARILRLSALYQALGRINEAITHSRHREELFSQACEIAVEAAGFRLAWIGLLRREPAGIEPVASHGEIAYLSRIRLSLDPAVPEGQGPVGRALRECRAQVVNDFQNAPESRPWHEAARQAGFCSAAAFPLQEQGRCVGVMVFYSGQPFFFDEEQVDLLSRMAGNISFALDNFRRDAQRRQAELALRESEERYWGIFDSEQDPIFLYESDTGVLIDANPAAIRLYGYAPEELRTLGFTDLRVDGDGEGGTHGSLRARHRKRGGEVFPVEITTSHFVLNHRLVTIAAVRDITDRVKAEVALKESEQRLRRAIVEAPIPIMLHAEGGEIMLLSHAWQELCGYDIAETPTVAAWLERACGDGEAGAEITSLYGAHGNTAAGEVSVTARDGRRLIWDLRTSVLGTMPDGRRLVISMAMDVTERRASEERASYLAHHDTLTGLPNRALLQDRIQQALSLAKRARQGFALIYFDLDRFKEVNDSLGHDVGDSLLIAAGQRLRGCVRESDTVGRLGGDEFLALLPEVLGEDQAGTVAEKIRRAMEEPFVLSGVELRVSASIGIALFPDDGEDLVGLLRNADLAMYKAKGSGRNRFCFARAGHAAMPAPASTASR